MRSKRLHLPDSLLALVARRFQTLGEPLRLRILQSLESGPRTVTDITASTGASQSNVSKHLKVMYDAGLVSRRQEGTSVIYGVADPMIFELCELVCDSAQREARVKIAELHKIARPARGGRR